MNMVSPCGTTELSPSSFPPSMTTKQVILLVKRQLLVQEERSNWVVRNLISCVLSYSLAILFLSWGPLFG